MNYTKQLKKALQLMTNAEIETQKQRFVDVLQREKNPMIRSSLKQRISLCDRELTGGLQILGRVRK